MQKDQVKILLVDDDPGFGKATSKAIESLGFQVYWAKTPDEAMHLAKVNPFQVFFVDCMLPKTPGIELAQKLGQSAPDALVVLISGIYQDKNFIRQAKLKSGCSEFLVKPFGKDQLEELLNRNFQGVIEDEQDAIPRLFASKSIRKRKILEAIEESDNIHGFELPFIYSLFLNTGISGQMNIIEASGDIFGATFKEGKIISVETNDPPSQLGEILVEKGLLDREDIEFEMAKATVKKIGQRLLDANLLSPHILDEVLVEQMEIRLSNTVMDTSIKVNFTEADGIPDYAGIEAHNFAFLLSRWFENRVSRSWLKTYYLSWMDHNIKPGTNFSEEHELFTTHTFSRNSNFYNDLIAAGTIQKLADQNKYSEDDLFLCLHLLAITKCIHFDHVAESQDYSTQQQRLEKLYSDIRHKNYFEILNLSKNAKASEIKRAYGDLSKILDSSRYGADAPQELLELSSQVLELVTNAYETVSDSVKRAEYLKELKEVEARQLIAAENIVDQGKQLLTSGQAKAALDKFNEAFEMNKESVDIQAYRIWARLKAISPGRKKEELQQIDRDISELSQQDRNSAIIHFVKGLYQKEKGNLSLAMANLENAISLDSNFIDARRELNVLKLKAKKEQPVNLLNSDLKDVVGMLFKRK